jgi:hypothetical protein
MSAQSLRQAIPTVLAVIVLSMMVAINAIPGPAKTDSASSQPTPYSADHSRIPPDPDTPESPPTF